MKKILALLLAVVALAAIVANAAAPSAPGALTCQVYEWQKALGVSSGYLSTSGSPFPDTLTGTGDSWLILIIFDM